MATSKTNASSSSLSTVVSNLVRAQMGSAVSSTVTDEDLDRHIAELILKEAKQKAEKYGREGVKAYLPHSGWSESNAPKTNKRFLSSIIRSTDDHNKTILRAQALAAEEVRQERVEQERRERRKRAEEAVEAEKMRRSKRASAVDWRDNWHSTRDKGKLRDGKRRERSWEDGNNESDGYDSYDRHHTVEKKDNEREKDREQRRSERSDKQRSHRHRRRSHSTERRSRRDEEYSRSSKRTSRPDGDSGSRKRRRTSRERGPSRSPSPYHIDRNRTRETRRSRSNSPTRSEGGGSLSRPLSRQDESRCRSKQSDERSYKQRRSSQSPVKSLAGSPVPSTKDRVGAPDTYSREDELRNRLKFKSHTPVDVEHSTSQKDQSVSRASSAIPPPQVSASSSKTISTRNSSSRNPSPAPLPRTKLSPSPLPPSPPSLPPPPLPSHPKPEHYLRSQSKAKSKHGHSSNTSTSKRARKERTRPRSPSSSPPPLPSPHLPSKMDKYFESGYDPRFDVAPLALPEVPSTGLIPDADYAGWDAMLDLIRARREDKEEKKRLERWGIGKDTEKEKEKGKKSSGDKYGSGELDIMSIEYKKKGSVREWDLGKEGF